MEKMSDHIRFILRIFLTVLTVFLVTSAVILTCSIRWMFATWSNLTMDELVYHLTAPLEGTNSAMIREFAVYCIVPALAVMIVLILLLVFSRHRKRYFAVLLAALAVSVSVSSLSVRSAWEKLDIGNYVADKGSYSTFIDNNYVSPADVQLTFPQEKRNLIYIFLESMEITYADRSSGGAFSRNVIPELTKIAMENEDFSGNTRRLNGAVSMPGTGWTVGAMFAQTSGLPLSISIDSNSMDTQDSFFAGAVTLGDILEEQGYSQTLLIGSDAVFGGRRLYFTEHGNYDIMDYYYARDHEMIPEDYQVWWGYEDEKLFSFAREKLTQLAQQPEPFNLTLLTVDTHFEDGYPCRLCRDDYGKDQYSNVMRCSSRQLYDLIRWIQEQDFYQNTTIVLCGDHPTMDSDYCSSVDSSYTRKTYTAYINSAADTVTDTRREYTTFDQFPTTLAALGVQIQGDRLGLGTNLFSSTPTLTERFGLETEKSELKKSSRLMEKLADIDYSSPELAVREGYAPSGHVSAGPYDYKTGLLPVTVDSLTNVPDTIQSMQIAVWFSPDQSDLQWIPLTRQEDGTYRGDINIAGFAFKTGDYNIHAYLVDGNGNSYKIGETTASVS